MSVKILKIKILGKPIYPATVLDAVKDAKAKIIVDGEEVANPNLGKTLREIIEENELVTSAALIELNNRAGALNDLTTDAKASLVAAINEVKASTRGVVYNATVQALSGRLSVLEGEGDGSVKKTVADAVANVVDGAPETFDTLKEIAEWITNDDNKTAADLVAAVNEHTIAIGDKKVDEVSHNATQEDVEAGKAAQVGDKVVDTEAKAATGLYKEIEDARQAAIDAQHTKTTVTASTTNGNIVVDGTEVTVFTPEAETELSVKTGSEDFVGVSGHEIEVKTSDVATDATGLAKAVDVYNFAVTAEACGDDADYEDVFTA